MILGLDLLEIMGIFYHLESFSNFISNLLEIQIQPRNSADMLVQSKQNFEVLFLVDIVIPQEPKERSITQDYTVNIGQTSFVLYFRIDLITCL